MIASLAAESPATSATWPKCSGTNTYAYDCTHAASAPPRLQSEWCQLSFHAKRISSEVGALLEQIRDVTEGFEMPGWACTSYRTLFSELEQMEGDIHRHVHLENHVLMPRFA